MNKIKVLIIDDEQLARDLLKNYLTKDSRLEILVRVQQWIRRSACHSGTETGSGFFGYPDAQNHRFEMLELLSDPPVIVFSTAYDEFAIRAFEANAVDYLLKPYPLERVQIAVEKQSNEFSQEPATKRKWRS